MTETLITRLRYPAYSPAAFIAQLTGNQIRRHLEATEDGLSTEHLLNLIEDSTPTDIQQGLQHLIDLREVCQGSNGWWYAINEAIPFLAQPSALPEIHKEIEAMQPPAMAQRIIHLSAPEKLRAWLLDRTSDEAPILLKELATILSVNTNTLGKAINQLRAKLQQQGKVGLCEKLDAAVIKRETATTLPKMPSPFATAKSKKPPAVAASVAVLETETAALETEADSADWKAEIQQLLIAKRSPGAGTVAAWQETLEYLDQMLGQLGVTDDHRSRTHLREVSAWILQN